MRHLFLFMLTFFVQTLFAQYTIDTVSLRFAYDVRLKTKIERKSYDIDEHWLDVGKNGISKYYSRWKTAYRAIQDSVLAMGGQYSDYQSIIDKRGIPYTFFEQIIFKNYRHQDELTGIDIAVDKFVYTEKMGQEWELLGDSLYTVAGHKCRKAKSTFHGRTWIAFYATDISIPEGPWKLCGLPGLIMFATDEDRNFTFACIEIMRNVEDPIVIDIRNSISITPKKLEQILFRHNADPWGALDARTGINSQIFDAKGRPVAKTTYTPILMEHYDDIPKE